MAVLIAGATALNWDDLDIDDLLLGDAILATPTALTLQDGAWLEAFQGQFTYANGELAGGTVTAWRESFEGNLRFDVSGFSTPVTTFVQWVNASDNAAARSTILAGSDSITGSPQGDLMRGYTGNDTIEGGGGADFLRGDEGNDVIAGGDGFDDVHGNMGDDTVSGGLGPDWVVGGKDNDRLSGDDGDDVVYGNLGNDTQFGGAGIDWVRGGQGDDILDAGAGNDWIAGDKGSDTITGGAGADLFHTHGGAGIDRVLDFNRAEGDVVNLLAGTTYTVAQVGADTVISMTGGGEMTLVGVQLSSLTTGWIFGA